MDHIAHQKAKYETLPTLLTPELHYRFSRMASAGLARMKGKSLQVLDVGCDEGHLLVLLRPVAAELHGIDMVPSKVSTAIGKGIKGIVHDVSNGLPYESGKFDVVYASEIIEHLYDTDFFLSEVRRVLRKGGVVVLSTPNLAGWRNRIRLCINLYPYGPEYRPRDGHIRTYTTSVLHEQLLDNGFINVNIIGLNLLPIGIATRSSLLGLCSDTLTNKLPSLAMDIIAAGEKA